jgi:hypothetical protein
MVEICTPWRTSSPAANALPIVAMPGTPTTRARPDPSTGFIARHEKDAWMLRATLRN